MVCFIPSEPVMPWTMTRESLLRKIAMSAGPFRRWALSGATGGCRELGDPTGRTVHRVDALEQWQIRLVEDPSAQLGVVAVEPHDQGLGVGAVGRQDLVRLDDAGCRPRQQAVIPPKTLTNTALTWASSRMTSSPLAMTLASAPPPMSRKLAGRG